MPYNSGTGAYERRATTVIDATPDGDTVAVAIDVKLDQGIDDYVVDLNHHNANGNHYPATSVGSDSRFLKQSPAGVVSWADGVVAADAALKDFSNVASGAILNDKLAPISPSKITQNASNRFTTDAEKAQWFIPVHDASRGYNHIINGNFDIIRESSSQTTNGYGSHARWVNSNVGSTKTASQQAFAVGATFPDGEICPQNYSRTVVTSVAGVANYVHQQQRIEFVRTLAGKKATLSFYAKADTAKNIAVELAQNFGSGGSPSADVVGIGAQKIALTTAWQRFTVVFDVPSINGKTIGSDGNDRLSVQFWFDAGSNHNARTDSLGQQSGTFEVSNVELVEGDVAIKAIPRSYGETLELCRRFFFLFNNVSCIGRAYDATNGFDRVLVHPVAMRTNPTKTFLGLSPAVGLTLTTNTNCSNYAMTAISCKMATDAVYGFFTLALDAEL